MHVSEEDSFKSYPYFGVFFTDASPSIQDPELSYRIYIAAYH